MTLVALGVIGAAAIIVPALVGYFCEPEDQIDTDGIIRYGRIE